MLLLLIELLWYCFLWLNICAKFYVNQFFGSALKGRHICVRKQMYAYVWRSHEHNFLKFCNWYFFLHVRPAVIADFCLFLFFVGLYLITSIQLSWILLQVALYGTNCINTIPLGNIGHSQFTAMLWYCGITMRRLRKQSKLNMSM